MRTVLEKHVGQPVDLRLKSGEKMAGTLEKVTDQLVHLSQLSGAEYFEVWSISQTLRRLPSARKRSSAAARADCNLRPARLRYRRTARRPAKLTAVDVASYNLYAAR